MFKKGYCKGVLLIAMLSKPAFAQELRDPTMPYDFIPKGIGNVVPVERLKLTEIKIWDHHRTAIINDHCVKVGDKVGENIVKDIEPYSVSLLSREGKVVRLHLFCSKNKERRR